MNYDINSSINLLKGMTEKTKTKFYKTGISTFGDMLYYFPCKYRDFSKITNLKDVIINDYAILKVKIITAPIVKYIRNNLEITSFKIADSTGDAYVSFFNQAYLRSHLKEDAVIYIYGKASIFSNELNINSPEFFWDKPVMGFDPIYSLANGLSQQIVKKYISQVLSMDCINEIYSDAFLQKFDLPYLSEALKDIHYPADIQSVYKARRRFIFDELIVFCKMLKILNEEEKQENLFKIYITDQEIEDFASLLPFKLTDGQFNIMKEIITDLKSNNCMNRLIQGDVGTGKTLLAFFAMNCMRKAGYQSILMAPTEVLANQHKKVAEQFFPLEEIVLLTGALTVSEHKKAVAKIKSGEAKIIIGTHALLYMNVKCPSLALLITDEQHRFGVKQRAALASNSDNSIHMLVMSATPIPRSLALVLYGKTNISILKDKPHGRVPTKTYIIRDDKRETMLNFISNEILNGHQAYFVCPLIEDDNESDNTLNSTKKIYSELTKYFKNFNIALLHGKMKNTEKHNVMQDFISGKIDILVSTTVIEVGVDVPNATIMVIENSNRFGLAQLHQLRGRIGRGANQSYCFLTTNSSENTNRLKILCQSNDGFEIAEKDMHLRGSGEIFGTRQHGDSALKYADLIYDSEILYSVEKALKIISEDPLFMLDLKRINEAAKTIMEKRMIEIAMN